MLFLILGLVIFLGTHSIRMFAPAWRDQQIAKMGAMPWKGTYAIISIIGFGLIVWGYGMARAETTYLWNPPLWTKHITILLMLIAMICLVATYVPGNHIKAKFGHPMLASVKTWAFAHLITNGSVADVVLFASFLVWSIFGFAISRRRDRAAGVTYPASGWTPDVIVVALGIAVFVGFAHFGHEWLIGVNPLRSLHH